MANNGKRERQADGKQWQPPRGIRYSKIANRPRPHLLHWRDSGVRKSQAFRTEGDRERFARELAGKVARHGRAILSVDPARWARYLEFQEMVGQDTDPITVGREWLEKRKGDPSGMTVAKAVEQYLANRRRDEPDLSGDTWRHLDKHLGKRFAETFGAMRLNGITSDMLRDWLAGLISPRSGKRMESLTLRHHRKDVNTFFKRAVREGWTDQNPCELVAVPFDAAEDVALISAKDAFDFFKANRDEPLIGRIALEAFGGLRYSNAGTLQLEAINFAERGITMAAAQHKSRKRKFRQGHPAALWAWLSHAPDSCWSMTMGQYRQAKREAFVRAKIKFERNVWRHSFASYLLAMTKNPQQVGYLMQHTRASTTEIYEGIASEADAKKYFGITPDSVLAEWC
jgi:site-specific recombinase XerD